MRVEETIRNRARELGFDACGFTTADPPASMPHYQEWLRQQYHGEMGWLERGAEKRADPKLVLPGARTIVVLLARYPRQNPRGPGEPAASPRGVVAGYACHGDYHLALAPLLADLAEFINRVGGPATRSFWYTDTGPILERDLAQRAGLGFIGKHTNLIHRQHGNWFLLAEILTTLELTPGVTEKNRCGNCARCLAACPTQAIVAPFRLDARLCISYLTIELKGPIPLPLRPRIGNRIFGCDDCLAVCPWNRFAEAGGLMRRFHRSELAEPELLEWLEIDEGGFKARFKETPLTRCKRRGLLRNVCVALGNSGGEESLAALRKAATGNEPLVAEHAQWAIGRIAQRAKARALQA